MSCLILNNLRSWGTSIGRLKCSMSGSCLITNNRFSTSWLSSRSSNVRGMLRRSSSSLVTASYSNKNRTRSYNNPGDS